MAVLWHASTLAGCEQFLHLQRGGRWIGVMSSLGSDLVVCGPLCEHVTKETQSVLGQVTGSATQVQGLPPSIFSTGINLLIAPPARLLRTLLAKTERSFRRSSAASVRDKSKWGEERGMETQNFVSARLLKPVSQFVCTLGSEHTLVQGIVCIGLEEKVLKADHYRVEIEHRLPVFAKDVEANVTVQIDVWVIDLSVSDQDTQISANYTIRGEYTVTDEEAGRLRCSVI